MWGQAAAGLLDRVGVPKGVRGDALGVNARGLDQARDDQVQVISRPRQTGHGRRRRRSGSGLREFWLSRAAGLRKERKGGGTGSEPGPGHRTTIELIPQWRLTERTMTPPMQRNRGFRSSSAATQAPLGPGGRAAARGGVTVGVPGWPGGRARTSDWRDSRQPEPTMTPAPS